MILTKIKLLKNNITLFNVISSFVLQIVTIISGFIIPRLILQNFGSEVNGLISSFNQFFGYISLVEGGLTNVVMAKLYKPLVKKDNAEISSIMYTTKKFYNKLSMIFVIYTVLFALLYPLIFKTSFSYTYVAVLGIILGIGLFIQYNFSLSLRILLEADKKVYIVAWTQILILIVNILLSFICIKIFPNVFVLKLINGLIYVIQPIMYGFYVKKYFDLKLTKSMNNMLLKDRWNGFSISLAAFIHNNTDVVLLTAFTNLKIVSIYSVYALVTKGIRQLITSISKGFEPTIGNVYAKQDIEELNNKFNFYEYINMFVAFLLFLLGGLLINSFVLLYTKNVTDINYNAPIFGILLIVSELIYCLQGPYTRMSYIADKFKDIKIAAYIETFINIVISLILIFKFGLIGVAIGTAVAMTFRLLFQVIYLKDNILHRNFFFFLKKIFIFSLFSIFCIIICNLFPITTLLWSDWIIHAILYSIICFVIFIIMSFLFFKEEVQILFRFFKKNK